VRAPQPHFLPSVAIALGALFRDETIAAVSLLGTGLVTAGAYLTSRSERRERRWRAAAARPAGVPPPEPAAAGD
jgi:hypothetical protein